ncbi:MAG: CoA-binding protein [Promethearchaeota archaeon]
MKDNDLNKSADIDTDKDLLERFRPFFAPKSIVIIGASRNEFTFNWTIVKNLRECRYKGKLYIIHPKASDILGVPCYNSLKDLPERPELAIILLSHHLKELITELGDFGINHCMIESDIQNNQSNVIERELKELANKKGMKIMGPSMIGIINAGNYFTSSIIPVRRHILQKHRMHHKMLTNGALSFYAQSGGLSGAFGWWTTRQPIPISKIIHIGHSINVSEAEIIQYLFDDPETAVISLYLRTISDDLINALKKNCGKKPVLFKMVGKDLSKLNELKECKAINVDSYIELFEYAKVFLWCPPPKGNSVAIIGPSSGAIHLLISEMRKTGLHLARLENNTRELILEKVGGSTCIDGNPVDYWPPKKFVGTDICNIYYISSNALLEDKSVDALFLALEFFSEIEFDFDIFKNLKEKFPNKPIIAILIQAEKEGRERIYESATELMIPVFEDEVERGIRAYAKLLEFYKEDS